ncbi:MAG: hypothetical protein GF330_00975, partial [Candidatus Eisenbacteria bacterium]|nr:hypothetical protein [Candidatus Eisenbacteria bacterium]
MTMSQIIDIRKDETSGEWIVTPGEVHASAGETLTWRAVGTTARLWFPQQGFMN